VAVTELAGLLASVAVSGAGTALFIHFQARRVRALPPDWREHPSLREQYGEALRLRPLKLSLSPFASGRGWLAVLSLVFAGLSLADFDLTSLLLFAGVVAVVWTAGEAAQNAQSIRRLASEHGLTPPGGRPAQRAIRVLYWTPRLMFWVGFLGAACFVGRLLADFVS
jgi:hypothetical protein